MGDRYDEEARELMEPISAPGMHKRVDVRCIAEALRTAHQVGREEGKQDTLKAISGDSRFQRTWRDA